MAELVKNYDVVYVPPVFPLSCLLPVSGRRERMKLPLMGDQCEQMLKICNEFVRLQVSYEEYLCMKVLLLLGTGKALLLA